MADRRDVFTDEDPFDAGLTAGMRGDLETAIAYFIQVLKREPHNAQAFLQLGKCETRRGNLRTAMESYRRGIKVAPQSAPLFAELGFLQLVTGDTERAHKVLMAARKLAKRNTRALSALAWLHVRRERWAQALATVQELLAVSNSNFAAHYLLAQVHEALGSIGDAHQEWLLTEEICRKMIAADERQVPAHYYLGEILWSTRTWAAGRESYEAAAAHAPDGAGGYLFGMGLAVSWVTVLTTAATACAESGDDAQAQVWRARVPAEAQTATPTDTGEAKS